MTSIDDLRHGLSAQQAKALCAFGEARGEPVRGICAVMAVIDNRVKLKHWGETVNAVVFSPNQFSSFNPDDVNCGPLVALGQAWLRGEFPEDDDIVLATCLWLAGQSYLDPSAGSTHYHSTRIDPPVWTHAPARKTIQIANHIFYTNVA